MSDDLNGAGHRPSGDAILIVRPCPPDVAPSESSGLSAIRTLPASLLVHALILAVLAAVATLRPLEAPPMRSIAVEIVSEAEYARATRPPPPPLPDVLPSALSEPVPQPVSPPKPKPLAPLPDTADPAMIAASRFLAHDILNDPENRQVRGTLPLLERSERITQLCNIEGLEQLRLLHPEQRPDSLDPSAMVETTVKDYTLEAPGGAYRLDHKWYGIRLTCTVAPDFLSVIAFQFAPGPEIPKGEWEGHNLIDEDIELD